MNPDGSASLLVNLLNSNAVLTTIDESSISVTSSLYDIVGKLNVGTGIVFSGHFYSSRNDDYILNISDEGDDSVLNPKFAFKFNNIILESNIENYITEIIREEERRRREEEERIRLAEEERQRREEERRQREEERKMRELARLREQGDDALSRNEFNRAIEFYNSANRLMPSNDIDEKIKHAEELKEDRYKELIKEGDNALKRKEIDKAIELYQSARQLNRTDEINNKLQRASEVKTEQQYLELMKKGDAELQKKEYDKAIEFYQNAQRLIKSDEIANKITESAKKKRDAIIQTIVDDMVLVKAGAFNREIRRDVYKVTISKDYYIGKYPVRQKQWEAVMGNNPSRFQSPNRPVENVTYYECETFIRNLNQLTGKNFRLPTEAEWEFAARGGNKSKEYVYSGWNDINEVAWYSGNSNRQTQPVGLKQANELGIYDMSGNVWEWCADWYASYPRENVTDPKGPNSGNRKIKRGGSWASSESRCVVGRSGWETDKSERPTYKGNYIGLRLVLPIE
jgi:formylglycine-generating enzyme required for sulfatase activity